MHLRVLILWVVVSAMRVNAETVPERGDIDPRVRTVPYVADEVYRLTAFVGYTLHIELESGEEYVGLGAGDSEGIVVDARNQHIFLKPRAASVATNLILLTNRRRYHFDYRVRAAIPETLQDDVIYSLRFLYSTPPMSESARAEQILSGATSAARRPTNYDYWYCGHPALKPAATTDDGVHTRIRFSARSEMPAIFVRNEDGSESLLNFSVDARASEVVIHRVASAFVLRRGRIVGCIVNRGYAGAGERLPSGTVAPEVRRDVRGTQR